MELILARNWWSIALRGAAGILFGLSALVWPALTLRVLVVLFGAYALVDGVFAVIAAVRAAERMTHWWALLIEGLLGIATGIVTFFWPGITTIVLLVIIASWALLTGVFEIVAAIRLRRLVTNEWLLALSGACSILFGVILLVRPDVGAVAFVWLIGIYSIAFGALLLSLGIRLQRLQHAVGGRSRLGTPHLI